MDERNVIAALAKVQADIGGIGKKRGGEGGITYPYRGIDAIASEAQPLFGREGIVIVPTEASITSVIELTVNGKPWSDTFVSVVWTVYGPGGVTDSFTSITQGVGRDNSDKGISKAMTQAFKNLLLRILCIGDPQDDADSPQHQNNVTDAPVAPDPERVAALAVYDRMLTLDGPGKSALSALAKEHGRKLTAPDFTAYPDWRDEVNRRVAVLLGEADAPADDTEPVQTELVPA